MQGAVHGSVQDTPILSGLRNLQLAFGNTPCYTIDEYPESPGFVGRSDPLAAIEKARYPSQGQSNVQSVYALSGPQGRGGGLAKPKPLSRLHASAKSFRSLGNTVGNRRLVGKACSKPLCLCGQAWNFVRSDSFDHNGAKESLKNGFEQTSKQVPNRPPLFREFYSPPAPSSKVRSVITRFVMYPSNG